MAWWLLHDVLNGTLDDEYPIKENKSRESPLTREGSEHDCDTEH